MRIPLSMENARSLRAGPGEALALSLDAVWFLVEGEVTVVRAGRPVELWRAPAPLDPGAALRGSASATFVAATDVRAVCVPRAQVSDGVLTQALADEGTRLWSRVEADVLRDDDAFLAHALAEPVPGPWHFRRMSGALLVVQGDEARLKAMLPRGVRLLPGTGGRYLLVVARLAEAGSLDPRDPRRFSYQEVTPFVPVFTLRGGPASFVPELYPDSWMATILGREIHGFPKRVARVSVRSDGASLLLERHLALHARWSADPEPAPSVGELFSALTASLFGPAQARRFPLLASRTDALVRRATEALNRPDRGLRVPVLVHKRIGSAASAGAHAEVNALVRVGFRFDPFTNVRPLALESISLGGGVLHGEVLQGFWVESGFRFGRGRVERRYGGRAGGGS